MKLSNYGDEIPSTAICFFFIAFQDYHQSDSDFPTMLHSFRYEAFTSKEKKIQKKNYILINLIFSLLTTFHDVENLKFTTHSKNHINHYQHVVDTTECLYSNYACSFWARR